MANPHLESVVEKTKTVMKDLFQVRTDVVLLTTLVTTTIETVEPIRASPAAKKELALKAGRKVLEETSELRYLIPLYDITAPTLLETLIKMSKKVNVKHTLKRWFSRGVR